MKHYITAFVSQGNSDVDKYKTTDTYANLEHAGSTLSLILKNKLSQKWELNAFSNEDLEEIQGNIITMVQGENSSGAMSVIWALHSEPEAFTKDGEMLPNYKNGGCDKDYSDEYGPVLSDSEHQTLLPNDSISSEIKYYPGFVDVDLKTGDYNVVSEQVPDTLAKAEDKLKKILVEAEKRGYTLDNLTNSNKTNVLKEVMVIGDGKIGFGYISDIYMPIIEPWNEQIQLQMFTYDMMDHAQKSSKQKNMFSKIIDFIKS